MDKKKEDPVTKRWKEMIKKIKEAPSMPAWWRMGYLNEEDYEEARQKYGK